MTHSDDAFLSLRCAGYGAVLARRTDALAAVTAAATKKRSAGGAGWYWEVEVLDTGVGGFSVGLCAAALQKPFKSLGNHPMCWVWHADGSILHNRTRREPPASTADGNTDDADGGSTAPNPSAYGEGCVYYSVRFNVSQLH